MGAGGSSVPGGGVGASNCFGSVGGSPERPVGSTREGTATGITWALADEKMRKIRNSAKDQDATNPDLCQFDLLSFPSPPRPYLLPRWRLRRNVILRRS